MKHTSLKQQTCNGLLNTSPPHPGGKQTQKNRSKLRRRATAALLLLCSSLANGGPIALNFDGLSDTPGVPTTHGSTITLNGFTLYTPAAFGGFASYESTHGTFYDTTRALFANQVTAETTLTRSSVSPFALESMGLAFRTGTAGSTQSVTFEGFLNNVSTGTQTFSQVQPLNLAVTLEQFSFDQSTFGMVDKVVWVQGPEGHQFANINLDDLAPSQTPVPTSVALFTLGLIGLQWSRRKKPEDIEKRVPSRRV